MAYWIKVHYERNDYVVDLDRIAAFSCATGGRITFWLPESSIPIVINRQSNPEGYQKVWDYVDHVSSHSLIGSWIRIFYDRCEYVIDLGRISSFCYSPNGKITFWLPNASVPIIITQQSDPDTFHKLIDFVARRTGQSFF